MKFRNIFKNQNKSYNMPTMNIERLPQSMLQGDFLHCRPMEGGQIVKAPILSTEGKLAGTQVVIVCPARLSSSKCGIRENTENTDDKCLYYRGDSVSGYQIIGPGMENKSKRGWES